MHDRVQAPHTCPRANGRRNPVLVFSIVLALALTVGPAQAHTYTVRPAADATVKQAQPNSNFGSASTMSLRFWASGQAEYTFLRFDLPVLAGGVTSASLRLRVTGFINELGPYAVTMGNPTWAENWLTWNNWQPGTSFTFLGSKFNLAAGTDVTIDVTGWVGSSPVTFGLASGFDVGGQRLSSKEGAVSPTLTLVTNGTLARCRTPGQLHDELRTIIETGNLLYGCDYKKNLNPTFGSWNGSSENLPVVAAAIALFDGPVVNGTDYRTWWQTFFDHQASTSGSGHVRFFKGSELFSNVYDAATVAGVLGARYWSHLNNHNGIKNRAADYLRRTFYAWSLGTSSVAFDSIHRVQGATRTQVDGSGRRCPTLALASPRSRMAYSADSNRWLLAKILGYSQDCYKAQSIKRLVDLLVARYSSVSGLSSADRSALAALINNTVIPSNLGSVLGTVRMERDYHFLLWNDGRRATYYLGHQLNNNISYGGGKHTVFTAFFNPASKDLDLLFIEGRNNVSCADNGGNRIVVDDASSGCSSNNWIPMPLQTPNHHFVLGPSGWRSCSSLSC